VPSLTRIRSHLTDACSGSLHSQISYLLVLLLPIIRPRRSTTYVDAACCYRPSSVVCRSVFTLVSRAKMAEQSDLLFGLWTPVGRRNHKFGRIHQVAPMCPRVTAHWRHLANTTEPSVCGGDAALCQITLTTCYYYSHRHRRQFHHQ